MQPFKTQKPTGCDQISVKYPIINSKAQRKIIENPKKFNKIPQLTTPYKSRNLA